MLSKRIMHFLIPPHREEFVTVAPDPLWLQSRCATRLHIWYPSLHNIISLGLLHYGFIFHSYCRWPTAGHQYTSFCALINPIGTIIDAVLSRVSSKALDMLHCVKNSAAKALTQSARCQYIIPSSCNFIGSQWFSIDWHILPCNWTQTNQQPLPRQEASGNSNILRDFDTAFNNKDTYLYVSCLSALEYIYKCMFLSHLQSLMVSWYIHLTLMQAVWFQSPLIDRMNVRVNHCRSL